MNKYKKYIINLFIRFLPRNIRNSIFHFGFNIAKQEFEDFSYKYAFAPNMKRGLQKMASQGFNPETIVDIGAFEGNWSTLTHSIWPNSKLYMFEPNSKLKNKLQIISENIGAKLFTDLLGAKENTEVKFYVMGSGSSVLEERSEVPRFIETHKLKTLDNILGDLEAIDLLKIDAQGYELEILKGATNLIKRTNAILLEVSLIEINKGAPLIHDVMSYMKKNGFVAYDILEIHRRPLDLATNQIDIIFIREDFFLRSSKYHA